MTAVANGHGNTINGGFTDIVLLNVEDCGTNLPDEEVPCSSGGHEFSTGDGGAHAELMVSF